MTKIVIMADDDEATLTEDEIGNLFQDTSSEEELGTGQFGSLAGGTIIPVRTY